jgi:hypothetical protein
MPVFSLGEGRGRHLLVTQEVPEEAQRLPRRVHRDLVPSSADRHECQALVGDRPPTHLF